jgi:hypothetical protein
MKSSTLTGRILVLTLALAIGMAFSPRSAMAGEMKEVLTFDKEGALLQPKAEVFREWIQVGTPLTPNDMNDGKAAFPEFHAVYIDPASWTHYKKTGEFRDGTVMIKELISVGSKKAASGNGYFMGEYIGLEVAFKDSKRFPKEPGNWAYFTFTTGQGKPHKEKVMAAPTSACNTCHQGNAAQDWVFTQYYPVLRASQKSSGM